MVGGINKYELSADSVKILRTAMDAVRKDIEKLLNIILLDFEVLEARVQIVAGQNYFILFSSQSKKYSAMIYQDFSLKYFLKSVRESDVILSSGQ
jgi:hypothetical protein